MDKKQNAIPSYYCPMHSDVRQSSGGKCPKCGMNLVPQNAKFRLLKHIASNPKMLLAMLVLMIVAMGTYVMLR
jgi:hypothetical protein